MQIAIILGTRPEIIKMGPIIYQCQKRGLDHFILHTGQHYSYGMDRVFFDELEIPPAKYNLNAGSGPDGSQTSKMLAGIEEILIIEKPDLVLVEGDTNTALAGSLAASRLNIKIGHVEAGLRSFDRRMPEEKNRLLMDHISDYLFAPTGTSRQYLLAEGVYDENIHITGNTIVDAVYRNIKIAAEKKSDVIKKLGLKEKEYFIATIHRSENVDNPDRLKSILGCFEKVYQDSGFPVVFPAHPRTVKRMKESGFNVPDGTKLIEPSGYLEFLKLEFKAKLILTDSGGVQEEACILGVPCVTMRDSTERPETVKAGANVVAGTGCDMVLDAVRAFLHSRERIWENPYGNGNASVTILDIIEEYSESINILLYL